MSTTALTRSSRVAPTAGPAPRRIPTAAAAILTLAGRRAALTSRTPRQIAVPLLGPLLLALIAGPALKAATGGLRSHIDYASFIDIGTIGLLVPLSCIFAGLSVIIDREEGAQRELLSAPVPRAYLILGNLVVALGLAALQVVVLLVLAAVRGAHFSITVAGMGWFVGAVLLFSVFIYAAAEALASRVRKQEDYVGAVPAVAILPFFFAGALFPITAMPSVLATIAKFMPLTHALALMRYAFVDPRGTGLHAIWGMSNVTAEAWLSLGVVAVFAVAMMAIAVRVFSRAAMK
ncbi:MAG: type transport system permease protein [Solirubrobacteraceae bacterium]|jgi:ABC-2 type transport system permease protein|nr:type transport system permease protein [Solirubrobacteraceae bacterium]